MLRMVIFDFDGVISDSEPAHFEMFRHILQEEGLDLSWKQYCDEYLGYDDYHAFLRILKDQGRSHASEEVQALCNRKSEKFARYLAENEVIMPGVEALLADLHRHEVPCSIYSGALRSEIEFILKQADFRKYFTAIVSAQDVGCPKPDPEGYVMALAQTNDALRLNPPVEAHQCLVIEDSSWGITAAKGAQMSCLAVETSYPAGHLQQADAVVKNLTQVDTEKLRQIMKDS